MSDTAALPPMPDPADLPRPWLAAYPPGVPPTYRYPAVPLTRFLDDAARDFPNVAATRFQGAELDYVGLLDLVDRFATVLADLDLQVGTPVAVALPNIPAFLVAAFAIWRVGGVVVPTNPELTEDELRRQLADAGCEGLVGLASRVSTINGARAHLPRLRHVIVTGIEDWLPRMQRLLAPLTGRREGWYRRIRAADDVLELTDLIEGTAPIARQAPVPSDAPATIQYTGGTTGGPKGVVLTHGNLVANAFQARLWVPDIQAGRERMLAALPLFHSYGLTMAMLTGVLSAATLLLLPRFRVAETLALIDEERPTLFPGVPTMYRDLLEHPDVGAHDLDSIRACVSGGAPLPVEVAAAFEQATGGARLREGYGLTEAGPLTHANPIYGRQTLGTIGLPVTDTLAIVVDPDDPSRLVAAGEPGELAVRGPQVMAGYHNQPDDTGAVLRDGWLLTGDIATCDERGYFTIVDRRKDLVIVGGANVYPREVEMALLQHPAVEQVAVVGLPDDRTGERVKAYVVLADRSQVAHSELEEHCRRRLVGYKCPSEYEIRETLPETVGGKVLRRQLRDEEPPAPGPTGADEDMARRRAKADDDHDTGQRIQAEGA